MTEQQTLMGTGLNSGDKCKPASAKCDSEAYTAPSLPFLFTSQEGWKEGQVARPLLLCRNCFSSLQKDHDVRDSEKKSIEGEAHIAQFLLNQRDPYA